MLLVIGPPSLRRTALDGLTAPHDPSYVANLATYGRALQQRNSLLRAIREGEADRDQLRLWDEPFLTAGGGCRRGPAAAARAGWPSRWRRPIARSPRPRNG